MNDKQKLMLALSMLLPVVGCLPKPVAPPVPEKVCCRFVEGGDMLTEDLLTKEECGQRQHGTVVPVDPGRLTPHPCCPDATGETCGDTAR
ncbi:hypothetical protein [Candidatus Electronema sp. TJ]|uniref:hypothetical protein n=1 Tax=Candidatus Electronema sp. TJ TaxID=3401573 RepID=UPI003AA83655